MLTVADLIRYRMQHERYSAALPRPSCHAFRRFPHDRYASDVDHDQHIALVARRSEGAEPALVRVHSHC